MERGGECKGEVITWEEERSWGLGESGERKGKDHAGAATELMNAEGPDGEGAVEVVVVAGVDALCCCCFCRLLCHCWCYCCLGDVAFKTQDMKVGRVDC